MTTFSTSLTNLTAVLPQSRDRSGYVSRPTMAPSPLWLQKHADQRAHDFAYSPTLWHQPRLAHVTCAWSWILRGINPAVTTNTCFFLISLTVSLFTSYHLIWSERTAYLYFTFYSNGRRPQHNICEPFLLIKPLIIRFSHHSNLLLIPWDHTPCLEVIFVLRLHSLVAPVLPLWKIATNCFSVLNNTTPHLT